MQIFRTHKKGFLSLLLVIFFLVVFFLPSPSPEKSANQTFEEYLQNWFVEDVSSNPLNLHYTLADPSSYGITMTNFQLNSSQDTSVIYKNRLDILYNIPSEQLSDANQLTQQILCLAYETELEADAYLLLNEVLSPSLGIQAQLPILLAEYTFREEEDIQNYLRMLSSVYSYFEDILAFEQEKALQGTFMSDTTATRIIEQCSAFIANPENNYLDSIFHSNLDALEHLTEKKKTTYQALHTKLIQTQIIPAYQMLIDRLTELKGSGKNENGLYYYPNGTKYYEYLLKSNCGLYESVSDIQNRLLQQMEQDLLTSEEIITRNPAALENYSTAETDYTQSPQQILETLQQTLLQDFPPISNVNYEVKYVHEDLEEYLSPAFYLTPPIDTLSPNTIYINGNEELKGIHLFTTLAHEGFPGHLYQTIYFSSCNPTPIRQLLNFSGYVEGWATYVESYAYSYYDNNSDISRLNQINQSMNLCILSFLDTKIHYDGWTLSETSAYLDYFSITDPAIHQEIFQTIIESPSNYVKYYVGSLHFADLREQIKLQMGENFSLSEFHKKILEIGPCQFPILEREVQKYFLPD